MAQGKKERDEKTGLLPNEKIFVQKYIENGGNGTQAAIDAGYAKKSASVTASKLLKKAKVRIYRDSFYEKAEKKTEITFDRILNEWAAMAFSTFGELQKTWTELEEFEKLKKENPDLIKCIKKIDTKVEKKIQFGDNKDKAKEVEVHYVKIELYDKPKALEELGKLKGYYHRDNEQKKIEVSMYDKMTPNQLMDILNKTEGMD